jgi:hypothetical protein
MRTIILTIPILLRVLTLPMESLICHRQRWHALCNMLCISFLTVRFLK